MHRCFPCIALVFGFIACDIQPPEPLDGGVTDLGVPMVDDAGPAALRGFRVVHSFDVVFHSSVPDIWREAAGEDWAGIATVRSSFDLMGSMLQDDGGPDDVTCCVGFNVPNLVALSDEISIQATPIDNPQALDALFGSNAGALYIVPDLDILACPQENLPADGALLLGCQLGNNIVVSSVANPSTWLHEIGHLVGLMHVPAGGREPASFMEPLALGLRDGVTALECTNFRVIIEIPRISTEVVMEECAF